MWFVACAGVGVGGGQRGLGERGGAGLWRGAVAVVDVALALGGVGRAQLGERSGEYGLKPGG